MRWTNSAQRFSNWIENLSSDWSSQNAVRLIAVYSVLNEKKQNNLLIRFLGEEKFHAFFPQKWVLHSQRLDWRFVVFNAWPLYDNITSSWSYAVTICMLTVTVTTVEPTSTASFVYSCMQTRIMSQYNEKWLSNFVCVKTADSWNNSYFALYPPGSAEGFSLADKAINSATKSGR